MTMLSPAATYHAELREQLGTVGRALAIQRALVNSFGFGGKNIVIAVSQVDVPVAHPTSVRDGMGAVYGEPVGVPAHARADGHLPLASRRQKESAAVLARKIDYV